MEIINLNNVFETQQIKLMIKDIPPLLNFFNEIISLANKQNQQLDDTIIKTMAIEAHREPDLSDHSSDCDESE